MKTFLPLLLIFAISLWAADFWQSKPYTEWSDKEVQKLLTSSPWAKEVSVTMGGGGGGSSKGGRSKGGGGDTSFDGPAMGTGGGNAGPSSRAGIQEVGGGTPSGAPSIPLTVSWRTALPLRQAVARQKFGAEAGTSADAKKLVEESQKYYAILITGVPTRMGRGGDEVKTALMKNTSLKVKGKDPIAPADLQAGGTAVLFLFPKTVPIDLDDKEVEFSTKLGQNIVKTRFKLKDMVFNGKLDL